MFHKKILLLIFVKFKFHYLLNKRLMYFLANIFQKNYDINKFSNETIKNISKEQNSCKSFMDLFSYHLVKVHFLDFY